MTPAPPWSRLALGALMASGAGLGAQDGSQQERIDAALKRARPVLVEHLRLQHGGVLALTCLAAVHDGMTDDDKVLHGALERLSRVRLSGTYDLALRLMVMAEVPEFPRREKRAAEDTKRLLKRRLRGGFTYAKRQDNWDLSNTQYAALGLRAAVALGQPVDVVVWRDMALAVLAAQADDGGFGYTVTGVRRNPYASMTVAGIAVLRLCAQQLGADAPANLDARVAKAWAWMAEHRAAIGDIETVSCLYFHYGLERAAILSDVTRVGDIDWYSTGAEMLLLYQQPSGAWRSSFEIRPGALPGEGSPVDVAFATLFLRRKFQKALTGSRTARRGFVSLGKRSTDAQVQRVAAEYAAAGLTEMPTVLKTLRSAVATQRRAAAAALHELAGRSFDYDPELAPADNATAIKAAELWWLKEGRKAAKLK